MKVPQTQRNSLTYNDDGGRSETIIPTYVIYDCIVHSLLVIYKKRLISNTVKTGVYRSDTDGNTSAAILYKYIKLIQSDANLYYHIHQNKNHGLTNVVIPDDINLVIVPDAGSNDVEECKILNERGKEILILDHHICDIENPYAIIVNNQNCNYPNKNLSGVGIVYKFLQALDDETWNNYADCFLDLVALGNIADNMILTEYETKRLVNKGINKIRNKFFQSLIDKQSYSIGNHFNIMAVQYYIVPLINGMIRVGDYDERDLMFRAFIETDEKFKYKPRGATEEIDEDIYTRCARLCVNAKKRQNISKDKSIIEINEEIVNKGYNNNKVIFCNVTDILNENMTGVAAMTIAEQYNRPCLLLRRKKETQKDKDNNDIILYGGSGRINTHCPIKNFKDVLAETKLFESVEGHQGAFGIEIKKENIPLVIEFLNQKLKDIDFSEYYEVDFILDYEDLDIAFIKEINDLRDYYATGFDEPYVVINNVIVTKENINLIGKDSNTLKIADNNGITLIKFRLHDNEPLKEWIDDSWSNNETINLTILGRCNLNEYNNIITPQIIIDDYEINR